MRSFTASARKLTIPAALSLLLGCNIKGIWVTQHIYRPKHPKFSILKQPFRANELINNNSLYVSKKRFLNYDGRVVIGYMGFYPDGRMIIDNTWENEMDSTLQARSSFTTASAIGYYTTEGNTIKMEFFLPGDGGHHETRDGIIKQDTIVMVDKIPQLLKRKPGTRPWCDRASLCRINNRPGAQLNPSTGVGEPDPRLIPS